ncbi:uncharacterized protein ACB057_004865 [Neosynchiropus ocellatus]
MSNVPTIQLPSCVDGVTRLYLGADLFSNTNIRTENHPRYHARFAKKGLAAKLHFSSEFRFHGLRVSTCNNTLWFYSIEGLFRVAFEIYDKQEQLSVLENLQDVWKSKINESPLKSNYSLSVLVETTLNNLEEKNVTETVMNLLNTKDWSWTFSSSLLDSVARWLGCQFHLANCSISQKVEEFKLQHIERISELPPAEELTVELFPEAMRTLLLHWMGLSEESSVDKRRSEYPILLLILEFANHSLITGVAHVLYSTLICK